MLVSRQGALVVVLSLLFSGAVAAQEPMRPSQPQIVTSGLGEVRVVPDRATVSIGVQTRALTAAEATATNNRKQRAVIDAIRARNVGEEQIATTGFTVRPETRYDKPGAPPTTTGYLVSNTVNVELLRTDLVGAIIDAAVLAGANQVHSLNFSIANPDSARRAAIVVAVSRAKGDADAAARAAGGTLGSLIELSASDHETPAFLSRGIAGGSIGEALAVPAAAMLEPGLEPVRARVVVRWQFIPAR